jgi:hypothetical protein
MREMTAREYFMHSLMKEVMKEAEKEGIKIVTEKSKPRLVRGDVVTFQPKGQNHDQATTEEVNKA